MHLFHKWGKWKTGSQMYLCLRTNKTFKREMQRRECLQCGKAEDRLI